jgi:phage/plasmid-like protein (TIGR03299 family)
LAGNIKVLPLQSKLFIMNAQVKTLLDKTNLNWTVRQEDLQTTSGISVPNKKAIVRDDNNTIVGVHSDGYQPYQNYELMDLLHQVSGRTGLEIHRGGDFKGGGRIYVQLKGNDLKLGNDRVEGYLTGVNSFDGSTSLSFGHSNTTISCMNTFFRVMKGLQHKVRHTKSMSLKVEDICRSLDIVLEEEKETFRIITEMSETRFDDLLKERVTRKLFNIKPEFSLDSNDLSTRTKNNLSRFYIDLNGELAQKGDNMWGLFSGVTKYTTHSYSKNDNTEVKLFGGVGQVEQEIFSDLMQLV